jgi:hypothetical protein
MYRRDYIQRMIEEFARVLARAMGLRNQQLREDALNELAQSYHPFFGITPEVLYSLSPEALIDLIARENPLTPAQADALARALEMEALLHHKLDNAAASDRCHKALAIYGWLKTTDLPTFSIGRMQAEQRLNELLADLIKYGF